MARFKQLVLEIHRRSLWQVLAVYVGASWAVLEATDQVQERFLMPEWVYGAAWIVLLVGFPIVLASALVREEVARPAAEGEAPERPGSRAAPEAEPVKRMERAGGAGLFGVLARGLTRGRAVLAVVVALALVGLAGGLVVVRGAARVTEAHGAAGDAFEERGWLVVAEFGSPAGEEDLGRAARTALMTDLGQSRYVNVFGDNQLQPVLRRMTLPDTVALDVPLALEVAEREGLAAVLAGSVDRLGATTCSRLRSSSQVAAASSSASVPPLAFGLAFAEVGRADSAVAYLADFIRPAAIADASFARTQLPAIERRLAELEESRGDIDAAIRHYRRFLELWSDADPELQYQVDAVRRALARLSEIEGD